MDEPSWFQVVGGPPPPEVVFRDTLLCLAAPLALLVISLWLPETPRLLCTLVAVLSAVVLSLSVRRRWWQKQAVRLIGNVLEHHDGQRVVRVALNRALVSAAAAGPATLVLVVDDGRTHLALGRRAEPHEVSELPPRLGPYLELAPEDFEEIRIAAHRSYPQA